MKTIEVNEVDGKVTAYENGVPFETKQDEQPIEDFVKEMQNRYPDWNINYIKVIQKNGVTIDAEIVDNNRRKRNIFSSLDKYAEDMVEVKLNDSDKKRLRKLTGGLMIGNYAISGAVGYMFAKTIFTGVLLAVGTSIGIELAAYKPKKWLYRRVAQQK